MQTIDTRELDRLDSLLSRGGEFVAAARKELIPGLSEEMGELVDKNIFANVRDAHGKVRSWQEHTYGSGYGYAAVHAKPKTSYKGYAVGYITNALENGHRIRKQSGNAKRYKSRIKILGDVKGRFFYRASKAELDAIAERFRDNLARTISEKMEESTK